MSQPLRVEHNEAEEKHVHRNAYSHKRPLRLRGLQKGHDAMNSRGVNFSCTTLWRGGEEPDSANRRRVKSQPLLMFAQLHN